MVGVGVGVVVVVVVVVVVGVGVGVEVGVEVLVGVEVNQQGENMERITGTLKFFGPTKDGNRATLTGQWDNGKDKVWCSWDEAQPLRDAQLVYKHPVETWDDGAPKWMVNGTPEITLEVEWKDKVAFTKVCVNGAEPAGTDAVPRVSGKGVSLDAKASYFGQCLTAAKDLWSNDNTPADVLYKTAFTLYKG